MINVQVEITNTLIILLNILFVMVVKKLIVLKSRSEFNGIIAKRGFSKRAFARESGMSEATFIQISNGKQSPRPDTAKKICDTLLLNFDDIFAIEERASKK